MDCERWKRTGPFAFPTFDDEETLNAIIDTPRGSRNKFKYDEKKHVFKLTGVLPAGSSFPYDFGFLPSTKGEDGDPVMSSS